MTEDRPPAGAPTPARTRRLTFPDALRGFAATWVVLFHIGAGGQAATFQQALPGWLNTVVFTSGHFGVPVFFVLSGFVIALSIGDDAVDARYVGRFALRRAIRLDLPYWAAIAIAVAVLTAKRALVPGADVTPVTAGNVLAHMFYVQLFLGLPAINPVFWTLTYEIQFYLAFCVLIGLAQRLGATPADRRPLHLLFLAAALLAIVAPMVPALQPRGLALANWHGFLLGAFVAWSLAGTISPGWFIAFAAALLGTWWRTGDSFTPVCVVTAVVLLLVGRAGHLGDWLSAAPLQWLGRISYSLYLLHVPVSGVAFRVVSRVLGGGAPSEALAAVVVLAINLAAAWVFWFAIERPSTELARRLRKT